MQIKEKLRSLLASLTSRARCKLVVVTSRTWVGLPNADVTFGPDLSKASFYTDWRKFLIILESLQFSHFKTSPEELHFLGVLYLSVKKSRKKSWNCPQMVICPPHPLQPSSPCPLSQKPGFYEQHGQTPLPSGFWMGQEWERLEGIL